VWLWWVVVLLLLGGRNNVAEAAQETSNDNNAEEIAVLYEQALTLYDVFPPMDPDYRIWSDGIPDNNNKDNNNGTTTNMIPIEPVQVVVGVVLRSIEDISPGQSEFTAHSSVVMYWTRDRCNQTRTQRVACNKRLRQGDGLRFFREKNARGAPFVWAVMQFPEAHQAVFDQWNRSDVQPDGEIIDLTTTYKHQFDLRYFPYEVHGLELTLNTLYSSNVVQVSSFPNLDRGSIPPSVPKGWKYLGTNCHTYLGDGGRLVRSISQLSSEEEQENTGGTHFYSYQCTIYVSRRNTGWWVSSFLLFCALLLISFAGSLGLMSSMVAEARDDRDAARQALFSGTRMVGTFTVGLMLVYVFQVEISPYGQPLEFWARIPTSTMVYILGLVAIVLQSMSGLFGALIFTVPFHTEGFVGGIMGPYNIDQCPKEGDVGEDRSPLLRQRYAPGAHESEEAQTEDSNSEEEEGGPVVAKRLPGTRRINMKTYNVLSVEEAILLNDYVRRMFFIKVGLLVITLVVAIAILVWARNTSEDLVSAILFETAV